MSHDAIKEGPNGPFFHRWRAALTLCALILTNNLDYRQIGMAADTAVCLLQTDENRDS